MGRQWLTQFVCESWERSRKFVLSLGSPDMPKGGTDSRAPGNTSPTWETLNQGQPRRGRLPGVDAAHTADLLPGGKGQFDPMRFVGVGLSEQWGKPAT